MADESGSIKKNQAKQIKASQDQVGGHAAYLYDTLCIPFGELYQLDYELPGGKLYRCEVKRLK